jgi:hypothetical protein
VQRIATVSPHLVPHAAIKSLTDMLEVMHHLKLKVGVTCNESLEITEIEFKSGFFGQGPPRIPADIRSFKNLKKLHFIFNKRI